MFWYVIDYSCTKESDDNHLHVTIVKYNHCKAICSYPLLEMGKKSTQ